MFQIFELIEGRPFYTLHGHKGPVMGVAFSPSGEFFSSVGADEQVRYTCSNNECSAILELTIAFTDPLYTISDFKYRIARNIGGN